MCCMALAGTRYAQRDMRCVRNPATVDVRWQFCLRFSPCLGFSLALCPSAGNHRACGMRYYCFSPTVDRPEHSSMRILYNIDTGTIYCLASLYTDLCSHLYYSSQNVSSLYLPLLILSLARHWNPSDCCCWIVTVRPGRPHVEHRHRQRIDRMPAHC